MNEPDYDVILNRQLKDGEKYDHLMPKTTCERVGGGIGNTDYSISEIKAMVDLYNDQTAEIAKVLKQGSLQPDALAIKDFIYDHFQYKADKLDQMLRAPSCSWYDRYDGIDCKSYSILASCLLTNMNYIHCIRKIRQEAPPDWDDEKRKAFESGFSHVYVIVPVDQKEGSLDAGYYCIDGTLQNDYEPQFIEAKDIIMDNFPHHRLLGTAVQGDGYSYQDLPALNGIKIADLKNFSLKNFSSFIGAIDCIGGSSLDKAGLKTYLDNIDLYYGTWQRDFNQAVQDDNFTLVSEKVNEFFGNSKMFLDASVMNKKKGWNSCTSKAIDVAIKAFTFYKDVVGKLLAEYVLEFFDKDGVNGSRSYTSVGAEAKYKFRHLNVSPAVVITEQFIRYQPNLSKSIKAFELTKYVQDKVDAGQSIDVAGFIASLTSVIVAASGSGSGTTSGGTKTPGSINNGGSFYETDFDTDQKTSNAGVGTLIGALLVTAVLGYAFTQMKDKPTAKKEIQK